MSSIVAALLFWLMQFSLVLAVVDIGVYVRERIAESRSPTPPRRWAVILVFSHSIIMFVVVIL